MGETRTLPPAFVNVALSAAFMGRSALNMAISGQYSAFLAERE
jgi:hypothetical protein